MSLTIIIPHFNTSDLLQILLASIPQDKGIQTIVIDDQSELSHLKVIENLKNKYNFELYYNDSIKSAGTCRNIGLEKAQGKWLLFADSDDYFVKGFYDKVSRYFDSKIDIVFFSPTSKYIDTSKIADTHFSFQKIIKDYLQVKSKKNEFFLRYNFISPWSKLIKKEFIEIHKIKFDEGSIGAEDVMLSTEMGYFMEKFDASLDVIYCRNVRHGSITRILSEKQFDIRLHARVSRIKYLKAHLPQKELNAIMEPFIHNKAAEFLLLSLRRFGFKKFVQVLVLYRHQKIKWFRIIYLNPFKVIKYIFIILNKHIKNNKYNIKIEK
jgi:glycosyltransferase involved in cell wall biosynthesis